MTIPPVVYAVTDGWFRDDLIALIAQHFGRPLPRPVLPMPVARRLGVEPDLPASRIEVTVCIGTSPYPGTEFSLHALCRRTPGLLALWRDLSDRVAGRSTVPWTQVIPVREAEMQLDFPNLTGVFVVSEVPEPERSIRAMERYVGLDGFPAWADPGLRAELLRRIGPL